MERKEWIMKRLGVSSWEDAKQELEDSYPEIFEWALEEQSSVSAVECMHQHVHEARRWIFFLEERLDDLDEVTKDNETTRKVLDELIFVPSGKIIPHLTTALFAAQLHLADKGAGSGSPAARR